MKVKLASVFDAKEVLRKIYTIGHFPARTSYYMKNDITVLEKELKRIDEQRRKLVEQHAERDEKGEIVLNEAGQPKPVDIEKFNQEFLDFLQEEVDRDLTAFTLDQLEAGRIFDREKMRYEPLVLSVIDIEIIDFLIIKPEEPPSAPAPK